MTPAPLAAAAEVIVDWHYAAAYVLAVVFPTWRLIYRRLRGYSTSLGSILHQAGTGFIVPAFLILFFSYSNPDLVKELSPHEMGLAGLFALLTSLRELFVDGVEEESKSAFGSSRL